ncbi:TPA: DNA polymerase [Streptococcus pyogenes]|uniref:DNA polymerase n=1 Tax=Streptococcus pyogenes TaxID=1314 RepID=UPI0003B9F1D0|nr:DNA polymerase [Streptococcus pyogenes]ESA51672.1 DNA-directed DNA polymerase domain protein [Streptococcus pyogenes GA40056]HER4568023.1 DNA polymerase [Streptococcus pyogenes NGAS640]UQB41076.1 DNA polymerase [Streptococcus pyogenes]VTR12936.1 phage DNA polymerase [Streptococcus pyogenes]HER1857578.1 DNA polymerase [Streptococcus pyogenes]
MRHLNIDIETYSSNDIKNGVYKYADAEDFEILLFAYSIDGGEVECLDLTRQSLPEDIKDMLFDDKVRKHAFNAQFERVCLSRYLGLPYYLDPCQWQCTMVLAQELGLPSSLEKCALYLKLVQEKDTSGKNLIRYFSLPCKPSKANGGRTRNLPEHAPEKWQMFIDYCIQDVVVEMAIAEKLESVPVHDREWGYYACDQRINDRGVALDKELVASALYCKDVKMKSLSGELKAITGLDNPNSRAQLLPWLKEHGYSVNGLTKADVEQELKTAEGELKRVLELKLQTAMSSLKKYEAMERAMCSDGRVHGLLQFYGASRTGRWAGRVVQVQNLARNYIKDLDDAREYVKKRDIDAVEILYDSLNDTLKQLVRTALVAKDCCTFYVSDFSAIEARVIAWFAGEQWRLDVFSTHGKIYEASASQMFGIPIEEIDKELRQKGKISELALGYQGGPGALKQMGALNMGVKEEELQGLVDDWRRANKKIVQFWKDVQRAAIKAIKSRAPIKLGKLRFRYRKGFLFITLPSGRNLAYARAKVEPGDYGDKIVYEGQGDKAYFTAQETYGGKLVENIVQATARDILAEALLRIEAAGYGVVFHVHDEAIIEGSGLTIEEVNDLMAQTPEWAEGLPLNSEGYITKYYMKD